MLTTIRERATGWIAWAIVILITIPFALWGVNSYFEGYSNVSVAAVEGDEIDYYDYQNLLHQERNRLRQLYGSNISAELLSAEILGRQVVNQMVDQVLLSQDARSRKYHVSDQQLADAIQRAPDFQTGDGIFSRELYERILQYSGFSPSQFEEQQRINASVQQIQTGFVESSLIIDKAVDQILALQLQTRLGEYAVLKPAEFVSQIRVSEEEIVAEYEENLSQYMDPEKVRVEFVELSISDFASQFEPNEETLREIFNSEIEQFMREEQRSVSHILLETGEDDYAEALTLADELVGRLNHGENFNDLAAAYSTDVGSASAGGSIGWISRGATVPEFEAVAFALEEGEISDPVKSSFGIHIIRVDEIQGQTQMEFEEVKDELIERATQEQAETEFFQIAEDVRNIAYEQPDTLDPVADALDVVVQTTDWFSRNVGTGIAANSIVRDAAFSDAVLLDGYNSDLVNAGDGVRVFIRKLDHKESSQLSLDEVRSEIHEKLLIAKSIDAAKVAGQELVQKLQDGRDWNEILESENLAASEIPSRAESVDYSVSEILRLVYESQVTNAQNSEYGGGQTQSGDYVIYNISEVVEGDPQAAAEEHRAQIEAAFRQRFGVDLYRNYIDRLRSEADVYINEEMISATEEDILDLLGVDNSY